MVGSVNYPEVLRVGDVTARSAAAQSLVADGQWCDVEALVACAMGDKSPSVRLVAAASAADIVARHRGAAGQATLTRDQQAQIRDWLRLADPVKAPALLLLASACTDERSLARLHRTLRDPRNIVRTAALAAVRRMFLSAAATAETHLLDHLGRWLVDRKIPSDVNQELARLAGQVGADAHREGLQALSACGPKHAEVVSEALLRLRARTVVDTWCGLWVSDGHDVLEPGAAGPVAWMWVDGDAVHTAEKAPMAFALDDGKARIHTEQARLIWAPRMGREGVHPAIQVQGFTWWSMEGSELVDGVPSLMGELSALPDVAEALARSLEAIDGTAALHTAAALSASAGHLDCALERYNRLCAGRGVRVAWRLERAQLALQADDVKQARVDAQWLANKVGARNPLRATVDALLEQVQA